MRRLSRWFSRQAASLTLDVFAVLRKAFQMFDTSKSGFIETLKISTILNTIGQAYDDGELNALIEENDTEGGSTTRWAVRVTQIDILYYITKILVAKLNVGILVSDHPLKFIILCQYALKVDNFSLFIICFKQNKIQ